MKLRSSYLSNEFHQEGGFSKIDYCTAVLMPFLAFGPTIVPGVGLRCEHISVLLFSIVSAFQGRYCRFSAVSYFLLLVAFSFLLSGCYAGLFPSFILLKEEFNALKFFLVFTPIVAWFSSIDISQRRHYLQTALKSFFVVIVANLSLQFANMLGVGVDVAAYFAGDGNETSQLWRACYGQGRYIGVFAQPANQGMAVGLFLIGATWFLGKRLLWGGVFVVSALSIFLGTSKVGMVALILVGMLQLKSRLSSIFLLGTFVCILIVAVQWIDDVGITGLELQFFDSEREISIGTLTAGRFGESSTLFHVFKSIWNTSPVLGLGAGELMRIFGFPYDNDAIYVYANGGLFALFSEIGVFVAILFSIPRGFWLQGMILFLFLCISSMGIVVFSGNGCVFLLATMLAYVLTVDKHCPAGLRNGCLLCNRNEASCANGSK